MKVFTSTWRVFIQG